MGYYGWRPYVPVAEKRRQAERKLAKLKKQHRSVTPVTIEGRTIAKSFWGKSWCSNLERYSDYENRLARGRTYLRSGLVVDLQIKKGEIAAMVAGSSLYKVKIVITPVTAVRWKAICRDCADMCKHVAAALYGVGARLDERPELLFVLRNVDEHELLASAGQDLTLAQPAPSPAKMIEDGNLAALFGLEMAETAGTDAPGHPIPKKHQRSKSPRRRKTLSGKKTSAAKKSNSPRVTRTKSGSKPRPV